MTMTNLANSLFSIVVLFLLFLCSSAEDSKLVRLNRSSFIMKDAKNCSTVQSENLSFPLIHIQGKCSPFHLPNSTWWRSILESIKGDTDRYRAIMKREIWRSVVGGKNQGNANNLLNPQEDADVPLASARSGNYIIKLGFGTPAQSFYTVLDTGSDIAWIPCSPSSSAPGFQPSKSPTFKSVACTSEACPIRSSDPNCRNHNCSFTEVYGDNSQVDELLSSDALAVGSQSQTIKDYIFGCAIARRGLIRSTPGLVGFGRGITSFVSQTAMSYGSTFSYCLPSFFSSAFTGSLRLGKGALSAPGLQFTPLLSDAAQPSFHFVRLSGISVGKELVSIPAAAGTIIDSGTVITRLVKPAYTAMRDSFRRQLSYLTMAAPKQPFDTCYNIPDGINIPPITLHFQSSVDLTLPLQNSLISVNAEGSVMCLAFALPPEIGGSAVSIIGNYQQQNFRVVYDVRGSRLGMAAEKCSG